jgi:hypothetical protein
MKTLKFVGILMFFLGLGFINQSFAQTTTWVYEAGDNSGHMARITTNSNLELIKLEYTHTSQMKWVEATIQKVENDPTSDHSYVVVKSGTSGRIYEINVYYRGDSMTETAPEGVTLTYWLKKN